MVTIEDIATKLNFFQISPNFWLHNFESPDTYEVKLNTRLVSMLEALLIVAGKGLIITSAYRTPEYNAEVGGAKKSYHLRGAAADVQHNQLTLEQLARAAYKVGFTGILVHRGHVHLDIRPKEKAYFSGFTPEAKSSV